MRASPRGPHRNGDPIPCQGSELASAQPEAGWRRGGGGLAARGKGVWRPQRCLASGRGAAIRQRAGGQLAAPVASCGGAAHSDSRGRVALLPTSGGGLAGASADRHWLPASAPTSGEGSVCGPICTVCTIRRRRRWWPCNPNCGTATPESQAQHLPVSPAARKLLLHEADLHRT